MLDTFAKRLNSQLRSSPGDISTADRWAIGAHVRPTPFGTGGIIVALGALAALFTGTVTGPALDGFAYADNLRVELRPSPGVGFTRANRYAVGGHFLFEGNLGNDRSGDIEATLGSLAISMRGVSAGINGRVVPALSGLAASLRGSSYVEAFFDEAWSLTPVFHFTDVPNRSGSVAPTLGGLSASLRGTVLPPDSVQGRMAPALAGLATSLRGTFTLAPARNGNLHLDFGTLLGSLKGSSVPPTGVIGHLQPPLAALSASFRGTYLASQSQGRLNGALGALAMRVQGLSLPPGALIGVLEANLGALAASLRGYSVVQVDILIADRLSIAPAIDAKLTLDPALAGTAIDIRPLS